MQEPRMQEQAYHVFLQNSTLYIYFFVTFALTEPSTHNIMKDVTLLDTLVEENGWEFYIEPSFADEASSSSTSTSSEFEQFGCCSVSSMG